MSFGNGVWNKFILDAAQLLSSDPNNASVLGSDGNIFTANMAVLDEIASNQRVTITDNLGNDTVLDFSILPDIFVNSATWDATNGILTLVDNDAGTPDITINLADLRSSLTDNGDGTYTHNDNNGNSVVISTDSSTNPYSNIASGLAATNAQDAIDELALNSHAAASVTSSDSTISVSASGTDNQTFDIGVEFSAAISADANNLLTQGGDNKLFVDETQTTSTFDPVSGELTINHENSQTEVHDLSVLGDVDWLKAAGTDKPDNVLNNIYTQGLVGIGDFSTDTPLFPLHVRRSDIDATILVETTAADSEAALRLRSTRGNANDWVARAGQNTGPGGDNRYTIAEGNDVRVTIEETTGRVELNSYPGFNDSLPTHIAGFEGADPDLVRSELFEDAYTRKALRKSIRTFDIDPVDAWSSELGPSDVSTKTVSNNVASSVGTVWEISKDTANTFRRLRDNLDYDTLGPEYVEMWAQAGTLDKVSLFVDVPGDAWVDYDLGTETSAAVLGLDGAIISHGISPIPGLSGWYRCWMFYDVTATGSYITRIYPDKDNSTTGTVNLLALDFYNAQQQRMFKEDVINLDHVQDSDTHARITRKELEKLLNNAVGNKSVQYITDASENITLGRVSMSAPTAATTGTLPDPETLYEGARYKVRLLDTTNDITVSAAGGGSVIQDPTSTGSTLSYVSSITFTGGSIDAGEILDFTVSRGEDGIGARYTIWT